MSPLGVVAVVGAVLSILAYSRRPSRSLRVNLQFALSLLTFALLWFATASSFAAEGMMNLPDHMIAHILTMFLVPIGIVGSSYVRSLWWLWSPERRRRVLRWWYLERTWHAPRWLFNPLTATVVLNAVMVTSHLPRVFDFVMARTWMMQWVVEPAFLLSGLFFFHFIVASPPRKNKVRLRYQIIALLATLFEMLLLAMSMSIFTSAAWYTVMVAHPGMAYMPGMARSATVAFSQQRLAAGILWICGDGWAIPCLIAVGYRIVKRDGSLFAALERQSSRLSGVNG
jgi:cytochrome c oxidase assembly factor CtaG